MLWQCHYKCVRQMKAVRLRSLVTSGLFWRSYLFLYAVVHCCLCSHVFVLMLSTKSYKERLRILDLPTCKYRRITCDMIETFKILLETLMLRYTKNSRFI